MQESESQFLQQARETCQQTYQALWAVPPARPNIGRPNNAVGLRRTRLYVNEILDILIATSDICDRGAVSNTESRLLECERFPECVYDNAIWHNLGFHTIYDSTAQTVSFCVLDPGASGPLYVRQCRALFKQRASYENVARESRSMLNLLTNQYLEDIRPYLGPAGIVSCLPPAMMAFPLDIRKSTPMAFSCLFPQPALLSYNVNVTIPHIYE